MCLIYWSMRGKITCVFMSWLRPTYILADVCCLDIGYHRRIIFLLIWAAQKMLRNCLILKLFSLGEKKDIKLER